MAFLIKIKESEYHEIINIYNKHLLLKALFIQILVLIN